MDDYEQHLRTVTKSFKNMNIQLLGFLLVAMGFIFSSEILLTQYYLFFATYGLILTIYMWIASLIFFISADLHLKTKANQDIFDSTNFGRKLFGIGLLSLSWSLIYLASYVAFYLQVESVIKVAVIFASILASVLTIIVGFFYYSEVKIPRPEEPSTPPTPEEE